MLMLQDSLLTRQSLLLCLGPLLSGGPRRHETNFASAKFKLWGKILGAAHPSGRMVKGNFQNMQEHLTKLIIDWGESLLAQSGREVLIKAIAQAIPTYCMSVFKLPRSICNDLGRTVRSFWWGRKKVKRKTHWHAWDNMIKPKMQGGMGFKNFWLFNQALAQQAWRNLSFLIAYARKFSRHDTFQREDLKT